MTLKIKFRVAYRDRIILKSQHLCKLSKAKRTITILQHFATITPQKMSESREKIELDIVNKRDT